MGRINPIGDEFRKDRHSGLHSFFTNSILAIILPIIRQINSYVSVCDGFGIVTIILFQVLQLFY
jgi:hypothetical protein